MQSKAATVDSYLSELETPSERKYFDELRKLIRRVAPQATESMMYGMPTYLLGQAAFCAFNRQKNYLSVYINPDAVAVYRKELGKLDCGKSCIRFKKPEDLPLAVTEKILREAVKLAETQPPSAPAKKK